MVPAQLYAYMPLATERISYDYMVHARVSSAHYMR